MVFEEIQTTWDEPGIINEKPSIIKCMEGSNLQFPAVEVFHLKESCNINPEV